MSDAKAHYEEVISLHETTEQISQNNSEQTEDGEKRLRSYKVFIFLQPKDIQDHLLTLIHYKNTINELISL